MPFTFSHPAAIIPIAKITHYKLPILALALGSCSPDFGYYTNEWIYAAKSHDFIYSLVYMLPICLLLIMIISAFKIEIIQLLPRYMKPLASDHIPEFRIPNARSFLLTIIAIIIGIYSHIIWDSFTHNPNRFKNWWPFIAHVVDFGALQIPVYKLLQHISSLVGMLVIVLFLLKAILQIKKNQNLQTHNALNDVKVCAYWFLLFLSCTILSIYYYGTKFEYSINELTHFLFINAVIGGRYFFIGLIMTLVFLKMNRFKNKLFSIFNS